MKILHKYPLCVSTWGQEELKAMNKVISSGIFTQGKYVKDFEKEFARLFGSRYACMVNSGSSANLLAVATLFYVKNKPLKPGDEVIVPAVSWDTTFAPLQQFGLKVKFVDIDDKTLNISVSSLRKNISDKTKLVLGVNLLGNPLEYDEILDIINSQKSPPYFIEDNCEAMGAKSGGKFAGTHGLLGTYSMFFSHHISTMEGGVVVTDDDDVYQMLISMRSHGWTRGISKEYLRDSFGLEDNGGFYSNFKFILPGFNIRSGELNGAIGLEQLKKLPKFIEQRRENAKRFLEMSKKYKEYFQPQKETGSSSWFGFSFICKNKNTRKKIIEAFEKNNVEVRPIAAGNFTKNPVIKFYDYFIGKDGLDNADKIHDLGLFIGNHHIPFDNMLGHLDNVLESVLL